MSVISKMQINVVITTGVKGNFNKLGSKEKWKQLKHVRQRRSSISSPE